MYKYPVLLDSWHEVDLTDLEIPLTAKPKTLTAQITPISPAYSQFSSLVGMLGRS